VKLALVTPGGVDESGTGRVIPAFLWLIERLARRHDVHVFALAQEPHPRDWSLLGARVHNVGTVGARRLRFQRTLAREHRVAPFDLVHALFGGSALRAIPAGARFGIPVVTHLTGGELVRLPDVGYGDQLTWRGRLGTKAIAAMSAPPTCSASRASSASRRDSSHSASRSTGGRSGSRAHATGAEWRGSSTSPTSGP
jgi:hypothetical protein